MGRGLGLDVVAEGLEKPEQLRILRQHECTMAQGVCFREPMPAQAGSDWINERLSA